MGRRKKTEYRRALEFAIVLAGIGGVLAIGSIWRGHGTRAGVYAAGAAAVLGFALLARPAWIAAFRVWMKFAEALGWVMTRVILSVFYFAVLTPAGWVSRRLGAESLDASFKDGRSSFWVDREPVDPSPSRYEKRY